MGTNKRREAAAKVVNANYFGHGDKNKLLKEYEKSIPKVIRKRMAEDVSCMGKTQASKVALRYILLNSLAHYELGGTYMVQDEDEGNVSIPPQILESYL